MSKTKALLTCGLVLAWDLLARKQEGSRQPLKRLFSGTVNDHYTS